MGGGGLADSSLGEGEDATSSQEMGKDDTGVELTTASFYSPSLKWLFQHNNGYM